MVEELPSSTVSWTGELTSNSFWATRHRIEIDLRPESKESYYASCRFDDEITAALVSGNRIKVISQGDPTLTLVHQTADELDGIYEIKSPREQGTFVLNPTGSTSGCTIS
jgi:hypothetical protein